MWDILQGKACIPGDCSTARTVLEGGKHIKVRRVPQRLWQKTTTQNGLQICLYAPCYQLTSGICEHHSYKYNKKRTRSRRKYSGEKKAPGRLSSQKSLDSSQLDYVLYCFTCLFPLKQPPFPPSTYYNICPDRPESQRQVSGAMTGFIIIITIVIMKAITVMHWLFQR